MGVSGYTTFTQLSALTGLELFVAHPANPEVLTQFVAGMSSLVSLRLAMNAGWGDVSDRALLSLTALRGLTALHWQTYRRTLQLANKVRFLLLVVGVLISSAAAQGYSAVFTRGIAAVTQ